jgi:hypothetical protein
VTRASADLDEQFRRFEPHLPPRMGKAVRWLRQPSSRWVRVPAALLLIGGGIIGFLPILGFWMVPLGLLLIAQDVPFLQPPLARLLRWAADKWLAPRGANKKAAGDSVTGRDK